MAVTTIPTAGIADGAVDTTQLADDAVTIAKATGFGKIAQVVQGSKSTQFDTSSTSFVDTGLSVSITPSSTSSKVLLMSSTSAIHIATTSNGGETILKFYRNTTAIGGAYQIAKSRQDGSYNQEAGGGGTAMYLDSPSSTSAISYKVYIRISNGSGGRICQGGYTDATITAMEVLA